MGVRKFLEVFPQSKVLQHSIPYAQCLSKFDGGQSQLGVS